MTSHDQDSRSQLLERMKTCRGTPSDRLVLLAIALHDPKDGIVVEEIAEIAGCSPRHVKRSFKRLELLGQLKRLFVRGKQTVYKISLQDAGRE